MTVQTFDAREDLAAAITVSDAAAKHFSKQIAEGKHCGVRLSLKQAGCTGYKYVIDSIDSPQDGDILVPLGFDVKLFLDSRYLSAMQGMEIDLRQEGLNKNLIIENPNIKDECGCGESFSIQE